MKSPLLAASLLGLVAVCTAAAENDGLDWLAGHWCGESDGARIEEFWLPRIGNVMPGLGRTTAGDRTVSFEFFRIEGSGSSLAYLAQPGGGTATRFRASDTGPTRIRFENPEHDFPTRIEYRLEGDELMASIAGPGDGGEEVVIPFHYRRCD